jgi:ABC-type transport system substrate-binding protein
VIVQYVPDFNSQVLAVKSGDADLIISLPATFAPQLENADGLNVEYVPSRFTEYAVFNQNFSSGESPEGPSVGSGKLDGKGVPTDFFTDVHARRAFVYAFDDVGYVQDLLGGHGNITQLPLLTAYTDSNLVTTESRYDLQKAEEEFKLAWDGQVWEHGFVLELGVYDATFAGFEPSHVSAAELLKTRVESLNPKFRINIVSYDENNFEQFYQGPSLFMEYWLYFYPESFAFRRIFGQEFGLGGYFQDDTLEEMIQAAESETDESKQRELLEQVRDRVLEQAYFFMLPEALLPFVYQAELKGVTFNPFTETKVLWRTISK